MHRSTFALLAAATLGLAAVTATVVLTSGPRVRLADTPSDADAVTLYQSGLAFVSLTRSFSSAGNTTTLVFSVPTTTILDSLTLAGDGVAVRELRSSLAATPLVSPGDRVVVHIGPERYAGTVLSADEGLLLASDTGTTLVDPERADAIEILGRTVKESGPGSTEVAVVVSAPPGLHDVQLTYLAYGAGWTPSHRLDPATGRWTTFATLTGMAEWTNVTLELVAGSPNIVATPRYDAFAGAPALAVKTGDASYEGDFGSSTPLGGLHRYRYGSTVSFSVGETVRLPLVDGRVDVLRHVHTVDASLGWGGVTGARQDALVLERYEIRNTLTEPIPPGVVRLYEDGVWIGEDRLAATPVGDRANITASTAEEVKARLVLETFASTATKDTATYVLMVQNLKAAGAEGPIDVVASLTYPSWRTNVLRTDPTPTDQMGTTVVWERTLGPGGSAAFRVTYETLRNG